MNDYLYSQIYIGQQEKFTWHITEEMEDKFRFICGDMNPLHLDDEFAMDVSAGKFRKHVSFGMLTASLFSTLAGVYLPGKFSLIHSIEELSFKKPVYVGDFLTVIGEVDAKQDELHLIQISVKIMNQESRIVTKGKMKIIVQR